MMMLMGLWVTGCGIPPLPFSTGRVVWINAGEWRGAASCALRFALESLGRRAHLFLPSVIVQPLGVVCMPTSLG